jgi:hypothetical protein
LELAPSVGQSGGMLLGFKGSSLEVGSNDHGQFIISPLGYHRHAKFKFELDGKFQAYHLFLVFILNLCFDLINFESFLIYSYS